MDGSGDNVVPADECIYKGCPDRRLLSMATDVDLITGIDRSMVDLSDTEDGKGSTGLSRPHQARAILGEAGLQRARAAKR